MGKFDELGDAVRGAIRAFHGSPYDFDRFDASKIGTGEGAQAYGRGLYFAGNEAVARQYRDKLSKGLDALIDGIPSAHYLHAMPKKGSMEGLAVSALQELAPGAIDLDDLFASARNWMPDESGAFARALESVRRKGVVLGKRPGRMYEVELGFPEEALLDYDRPFATPAGVVGAEILRQDNPAAVSASALRAIQDGSWRMESFVGRSPYETAAVELTRLAKTRSGAQALMDAGVPGVRYLDGQSRGVGQGTRNYVIFPGAEDSIRILRKYAIPGAIGTGAASMGGDGDQ